MLDSERTQSTQDYAKKLTEQLLKPTLLQTGVRSGIFFWDQEGTGRTKFLQKFFIPELELLGAQVVLVDWGKNAEKSPDKSIREAVYQAVKKLLDASSIKRLDTQISDTTYSRSWIKKEPQLIRDSNATTLAEVMTELVQATQTDVVLIFDQLDTSLMDGVGLSVMKSLKAARDAVNLRSEMPGHFVFVGISSDKLLVTSMTSRADQPFYGAISQELTLL